MCFLSILQGQRGSFALCNISNLPGHKRQTTEFKVHHVKPIVTLPPAWKTLLYRLLGTGTRVRVYFRFHVGSLAVTFTKRHSTSFFTVCTRALCKRGLRNLRRSPAEPNSSFIIERPSLGSIDIGERSHMERRYGISGRKRRDSSVID